LSDVDMLGVVRQLHEPAEGRLSGGPGRVVPLRIAPIWKFLVPPCSPCWIARRMPACWNRSGWKAAGISLESGRQCWETPDNACVTSVNLSHHAPAGQPVNRAVRGRLP
jgi:hypothetical protein